MTHSVQYSVQSSMVAASQPGRSSETQPDPSALRQGAQPTQSRRRPPAQQGTQATAASDSASALALPGSP